MDLEKLQFKISNNGELSVSEKEFLLEVYMNTFAQIYGIDIYDSLLKIVGKNNQLDNKIKKFSENYNKSKELFNELSIREDL